MSIIKAIEDLKEHPDVKGKLNAGLSTRKFIDHFIGVVEEAVDKNKDDPILRAGYEALQKEYPQYFGQGVFALNIDVYVVNPKKRDEEKING